MINAVQEPDDEVITSVALETNGIGDPLAL